jgi:hypothetical protein
MHRLRRMSVGRVFGKKPYLVRIAAKVAMMCLWPFGAAASAWQSGRRHEASVRRIAHAWWLAVGYNVSPLEYFLLRLWMPERHAKLDNFVYWHENARILTTLNLLAGWQEGPSPVSDKILFSDFCKRHSLRTPEIYAISMEGEPVSWETIPKRDLWLKPSCASSGVGAERWLWTGDRYSNGKVERDTAKIFQHVQAHSKRHGVTIVQEVIASHHSHRKKIGDAPMTTRIVTGRRRDGTIEIVDAMAAWPNGGCIVSQGGNVAMVDVKSGLIERVHEPSPQFSIGRPEIIALPDWEVALDLVRKGHKNLPHFVFLGWDVAFGETGPSLLEANSNWGIFHFQVLPDRPIGDTIFSEIVSELIRE